MVVEYVRCLTYRAVCWVNTDVPTDSVDALTAGLFSAAGHFLLSFTLLPQMTQVRSSETRANFYSSPMDNLLAFCPQAPDLFVQKHLLVTFVFVVNLFFFN